jgi:hypothetical protein
MKAEKSRCRRLIAESVAIFLRVISPWKSVFALSLVIPFADFLQKGLFAQSICGWLILVADCIIYPLPEVTAGIMKKN